jgi:hypothetical protein
MRRGSQRQTETRRYTPAMKRRLLIIGAILVVAGLTVAVALFKPWLLFVDVRVDDALPTLTQPTASAEPTDMATTEPAPPEPVLLSSGTFISHEHTTSGTVSIVEQADGSRVLAIAGLDTSNGPDVHVWLSASDVVEGFEGWFVAGGAPYLDLGLIKGNIGDQVYEIPADADLSLYRSVSLWCVQFSVSFGAAQLVAG